MATPRRPMAQHTPKQGRKAELAQTFTTITVTELLVTYSHTGNTITCTFPVLEPLITTQAWSAASAAGRQALARRNP